MRIQTNIPAMYAYNRYRRTNTDMTKTLENRNRALPIGWSGSIRPTTRSPRPRHSRCRPELIGAHRQCAGLRGRKSDRGRKPYPGRRYCGADDELHQAANTNSGAAIHAGTGQSAAPECYSIAGLIPQWITNSHITRTGPQARSFLCVLISTVLPVCNRDLMPAAVRSIRL